MPTINFAGLASGIDSNALIDSISQSTRQARVVPNEKKVTELGETNAAFEELKTKLKELQDLTYSFSTLGGGALAKSATSSDETKVTASASNSTQNGQYTVTVTSTAKNHTLSFPARYSDISEVVDAGIDDLQPEADRTITFTIGQGSNEKEIDVVMTSTMTAAGFITAFNNAVLADAPGYATASLVNVGTSGTPQYAIVINTNNEGTSEGLITNIQRGSEISQVALDEVDAFSNDSPATNAEFSILGITGTITKSSNTVTDVISGVTLNLQGNGTATISIKDDTAKTQAKIQEFVDLYNEIVEYINENNRITREEDGEDVENIFSPLAKSRTDDNFLTTFRNAMLLSRNQSITDSTSIAVNTMSDFGIQTNRDGTLKFVIDDLTLPNFKDAMAADSSLVNSILTRFGDIVGTVAGLPALQSGGGIIQQYVRANGLIDTTVTGNKSLITNLNDKIAQAEASIAQQEQNLRQRFARLESLTGRLQGQQQALTSALAGLG